MRLAELQSQNFSGSVLDKTGSACWQASLLALLPLQGRSCINPFPPGKI